MIALNCTPTSKHKFLKLSMMMPYLLSEKNLKIKIDIKCS